MKSEFLQEKRSQEYQHKNQIKMIEQEMKQRKKLINEKIGIR